MRRHSLSRGFTLIELMIAMTISLFIVAAILTLYVSMSSSNIDYLKSIRLNNELRAAMNRMTSDIRRAGHYRDAASTYAASSALASNPFADTTATSVRISSGAILFSYDKDSSDGTDTDGSGYRLNGGAVEYCVQNDAVCSPAVSADWQNITDEDVINITDLTFTVNIYNTSSSAAIQLNQVGISLTGELISDTDFTRTMTETVTVRNEVIPP
jgi:type IV pilus assembly protein PilW